MIPSHVRVERPAPIKQLQFHNHSVRLDIAEKSDEQPQPHFLR